MVEEAQKVAEPQAPTTEAPPTSEIPSQEQLPPPPGAAATKATAAEEPPALPAEEKPKDFESEGMALVVAGPLEKEPEPSEKKPAEGSVNRDAVLAQVELEKRTSFIKAWEENETSKAANKAQQKLATIDAWENSKKASIEAELKLYEEKMEKKKAEYAEKMKNKIAEIHQQAENKRAVTNCVKGEEVLKAQEMAAKYHAKGTIPTKTCGCF